MSIGPEENKALVYIIASMFLGLSIMFWPIAFLLGMEPVSDVNLIQIWPFYTAVILVLITIIDSMVSGMPSIGQGISHLAWVVVMIVVAFKVQIFPNSIYLLASLWFIHSLRSMPCLWQGMEGWWLWPAWVRDCGIALVLFLWSNRIWSMA